ncbi:MAG: hypothetical protein HYS81_02975 [Candidatus Aenigmatarchaeota archaeon]|nr:MAG: hypothetical protein HYS81_02975 [Candidatus Aenigmarchaeota archaeon]
MSGDIIEFISEHGVEIALVLIGLWVVYSIFQPIDVFNEERSVEGAATNLTNAINEVYLCGTGQGKEGCATTKEFIVSMPQKNAFEGGSRDPRWVVYWKRDPANVHEPGDTNRVGGPDDEFIRVSTLACQVQFPPVAAQCGPGGTKGACYGAYERENLEQKPLAAAKEENWDGVRNFWLASPCWAKMEAYWDEGREQVGLRFVENLRPDGKYSYCCDENPEAIAAFCKLETFESNWPEKGKAFQDGGRSKEPLNGCDYTD